jgi:hypothetical protein
VKPAHRNKHALTNEKETHKEKARDKRGLLNFEELKRVD